MSNRESTHEQLLNGKRTQSLDFDKSEFHQIKWFHRSDVPHKKSDPHMGRFLQKIYGEF